MISKFFGVYFGLGLGLLVASGGCNLEHRAPLRSAELPPLAPTVLHANRLWIDVAERMPENDCVAPANARLLCFERPAQHPRRRAHPLALDQLPGRGSGHAASQPGRLRAARRSRSRGAAPRIQTAPAGPPAHAANGAWNATEKTLAGEQVASRSRADFAYGAPLGDGASEVIAAIAVRIGMTLGGVPESRVLMPVPLPAVASAPLASPALKPAAGSEAKTKSF